MEGWHRPMHSTDPHVPAASRSAKLSSLSGDQNDFLFLPLISWPRLPCVLSNPFYWHSLDHDQTLSGVDNRDQHHFVSSTIPLRCGFLRPPWPLSRSLPGVPTRDTETIMAGSMVVYSPVVQSHLMIILTLVFGTCTPPYAVCCRVISHREGCLGKSLSYAVYS